MRLPVSLVTAPFRRPRGVHTPAPRRPNARSRARFAVALAPPAFALVVWAVLAALGPTDPAGVDEEYAARLRVARTARAEHPDRPLGLVLGTSRTTLGFQPELLTDPDGPYWVNAGRSAAGPVLNRVMMHRFVRDGVRPAVVVLEVMPVFFAVECREFLLSQLAPRDLWVARRYAERPFEYDSFLLRARFPYPIRLGEGVISVPRPENYLPRGGFPDLKAAVAPAERAARVESNRALFWPALRDMAVQPVADRAFRDTVREAVDCGARVILLRAPESRAFRDWYDPAALARFDDYLAGLARDLDTPVIDARLWLDEADFSDAHHALMPGAEKFTFRLAHEVRRLLEPR
ncbi:MAG: hypothetical protein J0I06_26270 [Planctomycetes bacterium]|nr:hypothetical protein [Planctomycetota bacterium]